MPNISPGIVEEHERLIRALFNPDHLEDGKVIPRAIPIKDLQQGGFSVQRKEFTTPDLVYKIIEKYLARPYDGQQRKFQGVAPFEARDVRKITEGEKQLFLVIDTALDCNHGHASIYLSDITVSEGRARELRNKLLDLLQNRTSVAEAFNN